MWIWDYIWHRKELQERERRRYMALVKFGVGKFIQTNKCNKMRGKFNFLANVLVCFTYNSSYINYDMNV